jgi:pimeloyl-ACP methyl ester carboxylesterase
MAIVDVHGEQLFFERYGDEGECNVVLIHGAGADHSHWPRELGELPGCRVFFLDLPGHGQSTGMGRDTVPAYARVVERFIATLGLSRVILCGHSMGGAIALTLALQRPAWLEAVVLAGSGARLKVLPALVQQVESDFPAAVTAICEYLFGPDAPPQRVAAEQTRYRNVPWRIVRDDFLACNGFDVMDRLAAVNVPTLIVNGDADRLTPLKYAQFLADSIPGARSAVIANAGHLSAVEKPAEFKAIVERFIDSLPA